MVKCNKLSRKKNNNEKNKAQKQTISKVKSFCLENTDTMNETLAKLFMKEKKGQIILQIKDMTMNKADIAKGRENYEYINATEFKNLDKNE